MLSVQYLHLSHSFSVSLLHLQKLNDDILSYRWNIKVIHTEREDRNKTASTEKNEPNLFSSTVAFSFHEIVALKRCTSLKKLKKSQKYITLGDITNNRTVYTSLCNSYLYSFLLNIFLLPFLIPQVFISVTHSFWKHFPTLLRIQLATSSH